MINRPVQHLIPSDDLDNFEEENDFENGSESAKENGRGLRRAAAQNADLIRHLQNHKG